MPCAYAHSTTCSSIRGGYAVVPVTSFRYRASKPDRSARVRPGDARRARTCRGAVTWRDPPPGTADWCRCTCNAPWASSQRNTNCTRPFLEEDSHEGFPTPSLGGHPHRCRTRTRLRPAGFLSNFRPWRITRVSSPTPDNSSRAFQSLQPGMIWRMRSTCVSPSTPARRMRRLDAWWSTMTRWLAFVVGSAERHDAGAPLDGAGRKSTQCDCRVCQPLVAGCGNRLPANEDAGLARAKGPASSAVLVSRRLRGTTCDS